MIYSRKRREERWGRGVGKRAGEEGVSQQQLGGVAAIKGGCGVRQTQNKIVAL